MNEWVMTYWILQIIHEKINTDINFNNWYWASFILIYISNDSRLHYKYDRFLILINNSRMKI